MDDDILQGKSDNERSPKNKVRARCPACNAQVNLRDTAEVWDPVTCPSCHTLLEITNLRPPTLDYAASNVEDDDWDDEEDWEGFNNG
ncbi:MAG: hypothetical protein JXQ72_16200 [Anaerolineae bacterium]|nr:hypothetical protein [Anaerolineae bacterium]